jgi:plastocyanin
MRFKKMLVLPALAAMLQMVAFAGPAHAAVILAVPGSFQAGFTPPAATTVVGGPLEFVNTDIQPHNVTAAKDYLPRKLAKKAPWCKAYGTKYCPLFTSKTIAQGATEILGTEYLTAGKTYQFVCTVHPKMTGTLVVLPGPGAGQ